MEQGDKHGPRLDEQMEREVESLVEGAPVNSRSREGRLQQPLPQDPDLLAGTMRGEARSVRTASTLSRTR